MTAAKPVGTVLLEASSVRLCAGERVLVEHLSVAIRRGELWCVLGPNGSGKSTLLHALAGVREPEGGEILCGGRGWREWERRSAARQRGLLLQNQEDPFSAPVESIVAMGRHPHIGPFRWPSERDRQAVAQALALMDLASLGARDVRRLSGGERQRVALAALLAQDPDLLLLDEPTAHLDLAHQAQAFEHLARLAREDGRAVVFATHDYNLALRFASHALLLDGRGGAWPGEASTLLDAARLSELFGFPLGFVRSDEARGLVPRW